MDMTTLAVVGIMGYVFAILGLVAFVRLGKLTKTLKEINFILWQTICSKFFIFGV